jgi:hypothetical protein
VAVFAAVAIATKHKHWYKTPAAVKPIAEPLTELLNTLPAEVLDRIERSSKWFALATGIAIVAGPDIAVELEYRKLVKEGWQPPMQVPPSPPGTPTAFTAEEGTANIPGPVTGPEASKVPPAGSANPATVIPPSDL